MDNALSTLLLSMAAAEVISLIYPDNGKGSAISLLPAAVIAPLAAVARYRDTKRARNACQRERDRDRSKVLFEIPKMGILHSRDHFLVPLLKRGGTAKSGGGHHNNNYPLRAQRGQTAGNFTPSQSYKKCLILYSLTL